MAVKLAIVTPEKDALNIECDQVIAPGATGDIGLLPGHVPLITALRPGVLTVVTGNKKIFHAVSSGYAEMEEDQVTVITDSCEEASTIDVERAKRAHADAHRQLEALGPSESAHVEQTRRASRAQARLDAVERR